MGQEPGTPAEIREFCSLNYDVTFLLFEKVKVKGADKCEIYRLLTSELEEPDWNFTKYLIDDQGAPVAGVAVVDNPKGGKAGLSFTFSVTDLPLSGWTYDSAANVVTCGSN